LRSKESVIVAFKRNKERENFKLGTDTRKGGKYKEKKLKVFKGKIYLS